MIRGIPGTKPFKYPEEDIKAETRVEHKHIK